MNRSGTMHALQLQAIDKLEEVEVPIPHAGPGEVVIRTRASTICTSDLFDISSNSFGIALPRILGHEGSGIVAEFGEGVHSLRPGDSVAVHPVVPCLQCAECKKGYPHLCTRMGHLGHDRNGTFAEYFVQRADRVFKLPANLKMTTGALLEPVAVCLEAIARAGDIRGRIVLVAGDGPFGNMIARLAIRAGAGKVMVSGREPFRLRRIPGVEIVKNPASRSVDVAILAVSSAEAVHDCFNALCPRGRLVVFSALFTPVPVDLFKLHLSELEIVGACNDEDQVDDALECLSDPQLALQEIITQKIPFNNWKEAFELARHGHNKSLKVALIFD